MQTHEEQWERFLDHNGQYLTHGPDKNGDTALHKAASGGFEHVAQDLIKDGHDINARNAYGESVMQVAVVPLREPQSDPRAIQQALIDAGVKLQGQDKGGHTLLHAAALSGDPEMCRFLVERGGLDVNAQSLNGKTSLHSASEMGRGECVEQLLRHGADPAIRNGEHKTARDIAVGASSTDAIDRHVEQRMKSVQLPEPHAALQRIASQQQSAEMSVKVRKL